MAQHVALHFCSFVFIFIIYACAYVFRCIDWCLKKVHLNVVTSQRWDLEWFLYFFPHTFSVLCEYFIYYVDHKRKQRGQLYFAKQSQNHQCLCPVPSALWGRQSLPTSWPSSGVQAAHPPDSVRAHAYCLHILALWPRSSCLPLWTLWTSYLSHSVSLSHSHDP